MTIEHNVAEETLGLRGPGFVGRERELAALGDALASPSAVVLIAGEAGIGKTRLVREFLATPTRQAAPALLAVCPPLRQPHTLGPITDAFRQLLPSVSGLGLSPLAGALRSLFPEWIDGLPPGLEPAEDASAARYRVFAALAELLSRAALRLLVVEDAHWADEATLEFLLFLASRQPRHVSMVLTYRPDEIPEDSLLLRLSRLAAPGSGLRLALKPLGVSETGGMMSSMLAGESVSAEFAEFVHQHTDGVPLAVEESVRVMANRADLVRRDGEWVRHDLSEIAVPPTIRDAVLERFGRLGSDAQAVLQAAAVLTDPAPEALLAAVAALPAPAVRAGVEQSCGSGLLSQDARGMVTFRHTLTCRAIYEAIAPSQRRSRHLRAGEALERMSPTPVAALVRHFRAGGDVDRWWRYAEATADVALSAGDEATAVDVLHDLVTSGVLPARAAAPLIQKMPSGSFTGLSQYRQLARAMHRLLDAPAVGLAAGEEGEVRAQLGRVLAAAGECEASRAELERAIPNLGHDPAQAARAMALLGYPNGAVCPAPVHLDWLRRAAAQAQAPIPAADLLHVTIDRATALLMLGEEEGWAEAAQLPDYATTPEEHGEIARAHLNVGCMAAVWGRYADAARLLGSTLAMAEAQRHPEFRDDAMAGQAQLDWLTGRWDGLAERIRPLVQDEETRPGTRRDVLLVSGLLHAVTGARALAEEELRFVLAEWSERGDMAYVPLPAAALARLWLAEGRTEDALRVTGDALDIVEHKGLWVWATEVAVARVTALAASDRIDEAAGLIGAFADGIGGRDAPAPQAALVTCRALLAEAQGDLVGAARLFGASAAAWQALPRPYDALLAREREAGCLLASGRPEVSLSMLQDVVRGLSDLGARGDALRAIETLGRHGIQVSRPWWGGRRSYGRQLSPRELDVVRLLGAGRTAGQIGQALFISPKTVAAHLDSARRKLGLSSRAALATWAAAETLAEVQIRSD